MKNISPIKSGFTKQELFSVALIFLVLIAISAPNFVLSLRRARDQVRRDDLGAIHNAMDAFLNEYKQFPQATGDGKIIGCVPAGENIIIDKRGNPTNLIPCSWGQSQFSNLKVLPGDPDSEKGVSYRYFSDGSRYQVYVSQEGKDEPEYDNTILQRGLACGSRICNTGRSYGVPTNISIEEYVKQIQK